MTPVPTEIFEKAACEKLVLRGLLVPDSFLPWLRRHAGRIGLVQQILLCDEHRIEIDVEGPVELIDMMEMACLLGPSDVWVDTVERTPRPC